MRALLKEDDGSCLVVEISDMYYDETGLFMLDYDDNVLFIPGVNRISAKNACSEILRYGYVDLYEYGPYDIKEEDE